MREKSRVKRIRVRTNYEKIKVMLAALENAKIYITAQKTDGYQERTLYTIDHAILIGKEPCNEKTALKGNGFSINNGGGHLHVDY